MCVIPHDDVAVRGWILDLPNDPSASGRGRPRVRAHEDDRWARQASMTGGAKAAATEARISALESGFVGGDNVLMHVCSRPPSSYPQ